MACNICNDIASLLLHDGHRRDDVMLGTLQDASQSSCSVHSALLVSALGSGFSMTATDSYIVKEGIADAEIVFWNDKNEFLLNGSGWQKLGKRGEENRISLLDDQWISLDQIQVWINRCNSEHGGDCAVSDSVVLESIRPGWLVDCAKRCLVHGDVNHPYLALSYVWGQAQQFQLTKATLRDLQRPGAFSAQHVISALPAGIRDALSLVSVLTERYIWVDCLCIVQDDEEIRQQEILRMAGIYHNASLTIVLASALEDGIKGFQGISEPRKLNQKTFKLNGKDTVVQYLSTRIDPRSDPWSKRAWTFQEDLFSHRILEFQNETILWRCRHNEWYEDVKKEHYESLDGGDYFDLESKLTDRYPNFLNLASLITDYNDRDLTFAEDAHAAFSSILVTMGRSFKGGFISGLPIINFDVALLWSPKVPMTLRAGEQYTGSMLPTWSWIAWQGKLDNACWYKASDHIVQNGNHLPTSERVVPLVHWCIPGKNNESPRTIVNDWTSWRNKYMIQDISPPPGWKRLAFDVSDPNPVNKEQPDNYLDTRDDIPSINRPEMEAVDEYRPKHCYTHESIPRMRFWYPFPMPDPHETTPEPVVVPHICCKTRLARLRGAERLSDLFNDAGAIALRTKRGRFAGALRPNH